MIKFIYFHYFDLFTIMGLFAPFLMKILPKVVYNTIRYIMVNGKFSTLEKIISWTFWIIIPGISAMGAYLTLLKVFYAISNLVRFCKVHLLDLLVFLLYNWSQNLYIPNSMRSYLRPSYWQKFTSNIIPKLIIKIL